MPPIKDAEETTLVLPLLVEDLFVKRHRHVETVRVSTVTRDKPSLVDEKLVHERVEIERVTINRPVDAPPPVRQEGDVTIMSVVEEVVVVERRLMLKEEVRIKLVRVQERHQETIQLREQDAVITRVKADPEATDKVSGQLEQKSPV